MFYFKAKASQEYLQVNRNKGMFQAGLKSHFLSLLCEEQSQAAVMFKQSSPRWWLLLYRNDLSLLQLFA